MMSRHSCTRTSQMQLLTLLALLVSVGAAKKWFDTFDPTGDANKDGAAEFAAMDANKDGRVPFDEFKKFVKAEFFTDADTAGMKNDNGKPASPWDIIEMVKEHVEREMQNLDTNKNKVLELEELVAKYVEPTPPGMEPPPKGTTNQDRLSKCKECHAKQQDYCIYSSVCVESGAKKCQGTLDHVTQHPEWVAAGGAGHFVDCNVVLKFKEPSPGKRVGEEGDPMSLEVDESEAEAKEDSWEYEPPTDKAQSEASSSTSSSVCEGGSLSACIKNCPEDPTAFKGCVTNCQADCGPQAHDEV